MAAQKGSAVLLKIGDGAESGEQFTLIGGLMQNEMALAREMLPCKAVSAGAWRKLAEGGIAALTIRAEGIFTDSAGEAALRQHVFSGGERNYQFCFGNGDRLEGVFAISNYNRKGKIGERERFGLVLESAGHVGYHAA